MRKIKYEHPQLVHLNTKYGLARGICINVGSNPGEGCSGGANVASEECVANGQGAYGAPVCSTGFDAIINLPGPG